MKRKRRGEDALVRSIYAACSSNRDTTSQPHTHTHTHTRTQHTPTSFILSIMGGSTEVSFEGEDAKKVFDHLAALPADEGMGDKTPPFNAYYNGSPDDSDWGYTWNASGPNGTNARLIDGVRAAIQEVGATGWFKSQSDCFPFANEQYAHGQSSTFNSIIYSLFY